MTHPGAYRDEQAREEHVAEEARAVGEIERAARARDLLRLPLLFHHGGPWTPEDRAEWVRITGVDEATTKVMCDAIRKYLES